MAHMAGTNTLHVGKYDPPLQGVQISPSFGTRVCQTHIDAICCKYALVSITFSHRSDEADYSLDMAKPCLTT